MRMIDIENIPVGAVVKTPTGRVGVVIKHLKGQSKKDAFDRVMVRYNGKNKRDLATLQPHLLKIMAMKKQMELF
mgnify:CR=1 FL=1